MILKSRLGDDGLEQLAEQTLTLLEALIDEMACRATARYEENTGTELPLWVDAKEAAELLGAGYTPARVKQLGHVGEIICDRKDPSKVNSPYIFLRSSLYDYCTRRIFQLDQEKLSRQHKPIKPRQ